MRNFVIWISVILLVLVSTVLFYGRLADNTFNYETNVTFDVNKFLLWQIINDVGGYKNNKRGLVSLEEKDFIGSSVVSWRENYNFGISKDYEIIFRKDQEAVTFEIKNNFTGSKTNLTFELSEDELKTYLKVTEQTTLENVFFKGLKVLSGRESFVNSNIKWIRVGLQNYLINK